MNTITQYRITGAEDGREWSTRWYDSRAEALATQWAAKGMLDSREYPGPKQASRTPEFVIRVNGRPYLGESEESVPAMPRHAGWTGRSPAMRSRIALGDKQPPKIITGRTNLRSELARIMEESDIQRIEIVRNDH